MTEPRLPLTGVRVVDCTQLAAGPLASKMLADYGAEVILVETETYISRGGGSRQAGPPGLSPINTAFFHNKCNTNKKSITLDLTSPEALDVLKRLIRESDIFIANRRPQSLAKLGLTYAALAEQQPTLIYVTMPMVGETGPRNFYGGMSWGIQAMSGLNMISGYPDRPPVSPSPWSHPDVSCNPLHAAVAILAALMHRRRTGQGQMIELSQYESSICWTGPAVLHQSANGRPIDRRGNRHPGAAPHDVYRCAGDRWCAISVATDEQWRALCAVLGRPELTEHPSYATLLAREAGADDLRGMIEQWTASRAAEDVMQALQSAGVPCAAVNDQRGMLERDPQLRARGVWTEIDHPELGTALAEDWGFRLSKVTRPSPRRAPLLGEHNDSVMQDLLHLSEDEINRYIVEGVVR